MINLGIALNDIRKKFNDEVFATALSSAVPVIYDNATDETPEDEAEWMRFSILPGEGTQQEFGSIITYKVPGVATTQIFTILGTGDKRANEIAGLIITAFRSKSSLNGVTFKTPYVTNVGRNGQYWQTNVTIPFFWRESQSL